MNLDWLHQLADPIPERELSENGQLGLVIARRLERYYNRSHGAGVREEASQYNVSSSTIRRWINIANKELHREPSHCQTCDEPLPLGARRSRRYCNQHNTVLARVHRHRAKRRGTQSARQSTTSHRPNVGARQRPGPPSRSSASTTASPLRRLGPP